MNVNLEYYRIFYYVAKYKNITAAAGELCLSQPAVSQAIKQLEARLHCKLFLRSAKGVQLTQEGIALYSYVQKGYEAILLGESVVARMLNLEVGEIRIGASDMTLQFYLLPYLEIFHEKYPNIKVTVTNGPTPETIEYLKQGKIDFGIVSEPFAVAEYMSVKKVQQIRDIFVGGNQFINLKDKIISNNEIAKLPVICLESNTSTRTYVEAFLKQHDIDMKPEFELATSDMIVQFALRNLGIGLVVENFAKPYLESGQLFEIKLKEEILPRSLCLVQNERFTLSSAAQKLLEIMEDD